MKPKKEKNKAKENATITPSQYFDYLKGAKKTITTEALKESYDVFLSLAEKYNKLGQKESLKKLTFLADTLIKEEKLIELGITTYIYKDVIEDYIENVADKAVKIIELSRYMREIPDELVETIEKSRELFDELYVIFTDYTGKEEYMDYNSDWNKYLYLTTIKQSELFINKMSLKEKDFDEWYLQANFLEINDERCKYIMDLNYE